MILIYCTDQHFSLTPPRKRTDEYGPDILRKMEEVGRLAENWKASLVLFGGDLFHRRNVEPREEGATIRCLRAYPCPIVHVRGNHDNPLGVDSDAENRAISVLEDANILTRLEGKPIVVETADGHLAITGSDWRATGDDPGRLAYRVPDGVPPDAYVVHLAHGEFYFERPTYPGAVATTPEDLIRECHPLPDVLLCGHIHGEVGIHSYQVDRAAHNDELDVLAGNAKGFRVMYVVKPGALSRGALTDADYERRPSVVLLSVVPGKEPVIRLIPLESARPAAACYLERDDETGESRDGEEIKAYVDGLSNDGEDASPDMRALLDTILRARGTLADAAALARAMLQEAQT